MHQNVQSKNTKKPRTHYWQHPHKRSIRVPERAAAAIALMEMGISDYAVIADALGLSAAEVKLIDMAEDPAVRQLGLEGIPHGAYFKLSHKVRCPKCDSGVTIAPCVACSMHR